MNVPRQDGSGEPSGSDGSARPSPDAAAAVEEALWSLRGRPPGGPFGRGGGPFAWGPGGPGGPAGTGVEGGPVGGHRRGAPFGAHAHRDRGGRNRPGGPGGRGGHAALRLLTVLADHGPSSVTDLAAAIGVDQPRASRLVQAAVEAGQVRRDVDPRDARRSILVLTDAGRAALSSLLDHRRGAIERALADFSPAERRQFADLLTRFARAWGRD